MQKTNSGPEAKAELDKQEDLKKRAAKQASKRELAPEVYPFVECTVLPMGDGKVSMGEHVAGLGSVHYEEGETFTVALPIATALYERGFVNFDGGKEALAALKAERARMARAGAAEEEAYQKLVAQAGG
jgi:hypothetical protein